MSSLLDAGDPMTLFELCSKLGEGSYGSVYKAIDTRDGLLVAIKIIEIDQDDSGALQKEIAMLKQCQCQYIVKYKGSFKKDQYIWIVMEYCSVGSLCDLMAICERTLSEEQIAAVMKMALLGLEYLHSSKKIHRDIKSGNLLLLPNGEVRICDLGVSAELATTISKRKTVIGTPYWMSPEVLQSSEYDTKADIWSLAITAIELAMSEPPLSSVHPMRAIFLIPTSEPPTLPDPTKWSANFNDFLRTCLQKDPERRPTATYLLNNHPFIRNAKSHTVIAQLVDECMPQIEEYRAQEQAEQQMNNGAGVATMTLNQSNTLTANATMLASNTANTTIISNSSGTMVHNTNFLQSNNAAKSNDTLDNNATMVFNSGTMLQRDDAPDYGTMVMHNTMSKSSYDPHSIETLTHPLSHNASASAQPPAPHQRVPFEEPSYMKHVREVSQHMKSRVGSSDAQNNVADQLRDLYLQQKALDWNSFQMRSVDELTQLLNACDREHEQERRRLDATYDDVRKSLNNLISIHKHQQKHQK